MTVRGSASWLDTTQQNTAGQRTFDLSGIIFYPAKVRGRLGAVWNNEKFTGSVFANHTDCVRNYLPGGKGASFTTFDATLRSTIGTAIGARAGWDLSFAGQDLLHRPTPLYVPALAAQDTYDRTNYSAAGG